jgi:hypothetical protein
MQPRLPAGQDKKRRRAHGGERSARGGGGKRLATCYSPISLQNSTIAAEELNYRVRNGNGCGLLAMVTSQES